MIRGCPDCKGSGQGSPRVVMSCGRGGSLIEETNLCDFCSGHGVIDEERILWRSEGKRLRDQRMERGKSCRQEAERLGMRVTVLNDMERGRIKPYSVRDERENMTVSAELKEAIHDSCHYHKPDEERSAKHEAINNACEAFMLVIVENAPSCPDTSSALRLAKQARMEANSALATKNGGLLPRW